MNKATLSLFLGILLIGVMGFVMAQDDTSVCDTDNLDLCMGMNECENAGGEWENGLCSADVDDGDDDNDNETETNDDDETEIECGGLAEEACIARPGCFYRLEDMDEDDEDGDDEDDNETGIGECKHLKNGGERERFGLGHMIRGRVRAGVYTNEFGEQIRVSELARNRYEFSFGNHSIKTELEIEEETKGNKTKFKFKLNNGRNAEIKIMPDVASERALERLRLNFCNNESINCSIQLKEVGNGNQTKLVYEAKARKTFKVFGFFKNHEEVRTRIDAETGEEIDVKRPWWAFLASESDEADENEEE